MHVGDLAGVAVRLAIVFSGCIALASRPAVCAAQQPTPVVPGILLHVEADAGPDTVVFRRSTTRAGIDSVTGTRTVVSRVVADQRGERLLQVEQRFPAGGGEIVDTAVAELSTMRAVAHRSHQPARVMRFDFVAEDVEGSVTSIGPAVEDSTPSPQQVHQALGGPIFDSNVIELVVAALPLDSRFAAELPFFIYERGGRVPMPVAVRDRARITFPALGERDAWVVTVGVPGAPATLWIDVSTRAVLRTRYDIAARDLTFTDDRITPLP